MKTFLSVFKNKEIMSRIFFTIMILFIFRLGAAITLPGVTLSDDLTNEMSSTSALSLINLLGGGALTNVHLCPWRFALHHIEHHHPIIK